MSSHSAETLLRTETMLKTAMGETVASALADPSVVEIMLNPDGQLWIERQGKGRINSGETMMPSRGQARHSSCRLTYRPRRDTGVSYRERWIARRGRAF